MADNKLVGFQSVIKDEKASLQPAVVPPPPRAEIALLRLEGHLRVDAVAPAGPIGLALSGGGIRSATFSLGVLQAFAAASKLASFDYLSTVSGGGYIGAWLSAWIHRTHLQHVQEELGKSGADNGDSPKSLEPPEVSWLRRYSNYLTPRIGLLSVDSWTLMAVWLRNVFLNLIVLVAFIVTLLLLPHVMLYGTEFALQFNSGLAMAAALMGLAVLPGAISANLVHMERAADERRYWFVTTPGVVLTVLFPGLLAAMLGSFWVFGAARFSIEEALGAVVKMLLLLSFTGIVWLGFVLFRPQTDGLSWWTRTRRALKELKIYAVSATLAIAVAVILLMTAHRLYSHGPPHSTATLLTIGPPIFLLTFGIAGNVFVGLVGRAYYERSREWWSRMNAWFMVAAVAWLIWMSFSFYAPGLVDWASASAADWTAKLLGAGWLGSLIATLMAPKANALPKAAQNGVFGLLNAAAIVFILGFIVLVSFGTHQALIAWAKTPHESLQASTQVSAVSVELTGSDSNATTRVELTSKSKHGLRAYVHAHMAELEKLRRAHGTGWSYPLQGLVYSFIVLLLFGSRVDVNKFSLHNLYKNRLIRCYLGASNANRNEQPFTGFDERDDQLLSALSEAPAKANQADTPEGSAKDQPIRVQRPFHIFNAALNIAQGKNLAWQERKAAAFAFTPLFVGYALSRAQGDSMEISSASSLHQPQFPPGLGYRPTLEYASQDVEEPGFTLGMAMATSGAAASPSMGPRTRPALAFVMTLFNVRIGRWSANTAGTQWRRASPRFGLMYLLQELFGLSNETRNYVYLSDGGHFDNLGIYELVRRRCSVIWVVDATADPRREFADLGRSIRQCRIDFGVEIDLPLKDLVSTRTGRLPEAGFVEGTIDYGPGGSQGKIFYLKPTLCGDREEPVDILAFATRNPTFPHQSTSDQFFSESQFESYRKLGVHIATNCLYNGGGNDVLPDVIPDNQLATPTPVPLRTPRPIWQWFCVACAVAVAIFALLTYYGRHHVLQFPDNDGLQDSWYLISGAHREAINHYAGDAETLLKSNGPADQQCSPAREPAASASQRSPGSGWLEIALRSFRQIEIPSPTIRWLWIDNAFVAAYVVAFVLGFRTLSAALRKLNPSTDRKWRTQWPLALCPVAVFAGLADYLENFLLFDGLHNLCDIPRIAAAVAPMTAAKFLLFHSSVIGLAVAAVVWWNMRRRTAHQ